MFAVSKKGTGTDIKNIVWIIHRVLEGIFNFRTEMLPVCVRVCVSTLIVRA